MSLIRVENGEWDEMRRSSLQRAAQSNEREIKKDELKGQVTHWSLAHSNVGFNWGAAGGWNLELISTNTVNDLTF